MAYGENFKIGDRIAYENIGFWSFGTIASVEGPDRYIVKWDDGFDDASFGFTTASFYSADELTAESNAPAA